MDHFRFRVYEEESKRPLAGLELAAEAVFVEGASLDASTAKESPEVANDRLISVSLGVLATAYNGYISFYWDCCYRKLRLKELLIYLPGHKKKGWDVAETLIKSGNDSPVDLFVKEDFVSQVPRNYQLPAVQSPSHLDFAFTQLANKHTQLIFGNDACEKMVPQHVQKSCYEIYHVVPDGRGDVKVDTLQGPHGNLLVQEVDLMLSEVCWNWLGYSLGRLVNSISLAPCETAHFAVKNWRIDSENYSEESTVEEFRETMVEESMNGMLRDLGIGLRINPFSLKSPTNWPSLIGFIFNSIRGTNNLVDIGIKSQKKMISQLARNVSRLKSVHKIALQRNSTEGSSSFTGRTLSNLNQCHSQTTNFFEVVDNYDVSSCLKERRKGLLVKYENTDFTSQSIFCNRHLFTGNLLDPALEECLESIGKVASCCEPEEENDCIRVKQLRVKITIGNNGTGSLIRVALRINGVLEYYFIPRGSDNRYKKGHSYEETISLGDGICATDITEVGLQNDKDNITDGAFNISSMGIQYSSPDFSGFKPFFSHGAHGEVNGDETDMLGAPSPWMPPQEPVQNVCSEEETCCTEQLVDHFNCNKLYYNQIVWRYENPQSRLARFSAYQYEGASLAHAINNQPIAVWGEWVAFELADTYIRPMRPCVSSREIVSLPTGGLFSESLLGKCNSCEKPDEDLYRIRSEYPCNCGCKTEPVEP